MTEPYLRAWIALAFVAFGVSGIALLFLLVVVIEGEWPSFSSDQNIVISIILTAPVISLVAVLKRRAFLKLKTGAQWLLAIGTGILLIGSIVKFFR
jgi:hypothetical protein